MPRGPYPGCRASPGRAAVANDLDNVGGDYSDSLVRFAPMVCVIGHLTYQLRAGVFSINQYYTGQACCCALTGYFPARMDTTSRHVDQRIKNRLSANSVAVAFKRGIFPSFTTPLHVFLCRKKRTLQGFYPCISFGHKLPIPAA